MHFDRVRSAASIHTHGLNALAVRLKKACTDEQKEKKAPCYDPGGERGIYVADCGPRRDAARSAAPASSRRVSVRGGVEAFHSRGGGRFLPISVREEAAKLIAAAGKRGRYPDRDRLLAASRLSAWGLRASEAVMTSAKVARHLSTVWTNITPALSDTTHLENSL